jgi:hypothetical protein
MKEYDFQAVAAVLCRGALSGLRAATEPRYNK